jgi:hypothetical protein
MRLIKVMKYGAWTMLALVLILLIMRAISSKELDDVTPGIPCEQELLDKSEVLWVIPLFNNVSIANNTEWCTSILNLNKQMQLHGVYHTFNEFSYPRSAEYLQTGIKAFEQCLNQTPTKFKPPQLAYTRENNNILDQARLKRVGKLHQLFHKVYHCQDTGIFPNKLIDWI